MIIVTQISILIKIHYEIDILRRKCVIILIVIIFKHSTIISHFAYKSEFQNRFSEIFYCLIFLVFFLFRVLFILYNYIIIRELIFEVETFFISLYYILSHFSYSYLFITNLFRKFNTSITGDIDTSNFIHIRLKNVTFFFFFDNGICNVLNYFFILFISFFSRIIIFIFCMLQNLIERTYLELEQKYYTRINEAC